MSCVACQLCRLVAMPMTIWYGVAAAAAVWCSLHFLFGIGRWSDRHLCSRLILYIWTMVRTDGEHDMKLMAMKRVKLLYFMFVWTEHCVITVWLTQIHSLSLVLRLMLLLQQYRTFQHICEQRMMTEKTMVNDFLNGGFIFSKIS